MARSNTLPIEQQLPTEEIVAETDYSKYEEAAANADVAPNKMADAIPAGETKEVTKLSEAAQVIIDTTATKSVKIRGLLALGLKRGEVAKILGIRYQHVRHVEITPIKKAG